MISGVMPKWHRGVQTFAFAFLSLLFGGLGLVSLRLLFFGPRESANKAAVFGSLVMLALSASLIGMNMWFRRRIVDEFSYDGRALRFRTLGAPAVQTRDVSEIAAVSLWQGRGGSHGYRIRFRDGEKIFLQNTVPNSGEAAEQILRGVRS